MSNSASLMRMASRMRWLCFGLIGISLLVALWFIVQWMVDPLSTINIFKPRGLRVDEVPFAVQLGLFVIAAVGLALFCAALCRLAQMFSNIIDGAIFEPRTAEALQSAGALFLAFAIWGFLARTLNVLLLTANNAPGFRSLSVGISSNELFPILLAGILYTVGHVLYVAADIDRENKEFV